MNKYKIGINTINVIDELVKNINLSLKEKNYFGALFFSLALPDICGKIYSLTLNEVKITNKERYIKRVNDFVNKAILDVKNEETDFPYLEAVQYYKIRCGIYHQGEIEVECESEKNIFILNDFEFIARLEKPGCDMFSEEKDEKYKIGASIDISRFCTLILWGVDKFKRYLNKFESVNQPLITIKCY